MPSAMKGVLLMGSGGSNDRALLEVHQPDNPAIDYIGRWDGSKTARWVGSSLRFAFTGPLLFLTPGQKTVSTVETQRRGDERRGTPTIGWTIYSRSRRSRSRRSRSKRRSGNAGNDTSNTTVASGTTTGSPSAHPAAIDGADARHEQDDDDDDEEEDDHDDHDIVSTSYTAVARPGVSLRLWPPEGNRYIPPSLSSSSSPSSSSVLDDATPTQSRRASRAVVDGHGARESTTPTSPLKASSTSMSMAHSLSSSSSSSAIPAQSVPPSTSDPPQGETKETSALQDQQQAARHTNDHDVHDSSHKRQDGLQRSRYDDDEQEEELHIIEVTLIDWASMLQVAHLQTLSGHTISPAYPRGLVNLPTMLFIGDSLTSGFRPTSTTSGYATPVASAAPSTIDGIPPRAGDGDEDDTAGNTITTTIYTTSAVNPQTDHHTAPPYNGFFDAFPSQLKSLINPGLRVYPIAFPGIRLVDDPSDGREGMESKWFKAGPRGKPGHSLKTLTTSALSFGSRAPQGKTEAALDFTTDVPSFSAVDKDEADPFSQDGGPGPVRTSIVSGAREDGDVEVGKTDIDNGDDDEWSFEERESDAGPTHILVNLGTNDVLPCKEFLDTYKNFLDMLRETHGRRTGDIIVLLPFGRLYDGEDEGEGEARGRSQEGGGECLSRYPAQQVREMVEGLAQTWQEAGELASGNFPSTPLLELTKMRIENAGAHNPHQLDTGGGGAQGSYFTAKGGSLLSSWSGLKSGRQSKQQQQQQDNRSASISSNKIPSPQSAISPTQSSSSSAGTTTTTSTTTTTRPSLLVRPSSMQAALVPTSKGTKARLHFVDTTGWLDERATDTYDGLHPTPRGALKIATKLCDWFAENGFLVD